MVGFSMHVLEKLKFHGKKGFDIVLISGVPDNTLKKQQNLEVVFNTLESNRFLQVCVIWQGEFYYTIRLPVVINSNLKNYFFKGQLSKYQEMESMNILMGSHFHRFSISQKIYCVTGKRQKNVGPDGLVFHFVQQRLFTRQEILTDMDKH